MSVSDTKGINPSRILNLDSSKDDLTCSFCFLIVWEAVCCNCCEAHYCESCISSWLSVHTECPHCRQVFQSHSIPRISKNILARLKISCIFEENGCKEPIDYFNIYDHEVNCEFRLEVCPNSECGLKMTVKELKAHIPECPHLIVKCAHCDQKLKNFDKLQHEAECPFRKVICCFELCQSPLLAKDYESHVKNCGFKIMTCEHCQNEILKKELEPHEENCEEKLINCKGCNSEMKKKDVLDHESKCDLIEVICEVCDLNLKRKDLNDHNPMECHKLAILQIKKGGCNIIAKDSEISELKKKISSLEEEVISLKIEIKNIKASSSAPIKNASLPSYIYSDYQHKKLVLPITSNLKISQISKPKTLETTSDNQSMSSRRNNIISMLLLTDSLVFLGTDSGKLSLWNILTDQQLGIVSLFPSLEIKALCLFDYMGYNEDKLDFEKKKESNSLGTKGVWLISGHGNGEMCVWDVDFDETWEKCEFKKTSTMIVSKNKISSIIDFGDHTHIICSTYTKLNQIDFWDGLSDSLVFSLEKPHKETISKLLLFESGAKFLSSSDDGYVKLWNVTKDINKKITNVSLENLIQANEPIWNLGILSQNRIVLSLNNNSLEIWDIFNKKLIHRSNLEEEELGVAGDFVILSRNNIAEKEVKNAAHDEEFSIEDEKNNEEDVENHNSDIIIALHKEKIVFYDEQLNAIYNVKQNNNEFKWGFAGSHLMQLVHAKINNAGEKKEILVKLAILGQKGRKISLLEIDIN